jgi:hypothetical protein
LARIYPECWLIFLFFHNTANTSSRILIYVSNRVDWTYYVRNIIRTKRVESVYRYVWVTIKIECLLVPGPSTVMPNLLAQKSYKREGFEVTITTTIGSAVVVIEKQMSVWSKKEIVTFTLARREKSVSVRPAKRVTLYPLVPDELRANGRGMPEID